jgi:hypothetical protein
VEARLDVTFLNAAFLFAALAALLPLVIHLISRRRVETVEWSSLRFLKELERRRIRRVRIRQILLLVIRSLIILFVAVALARPTLQGPLAGSVGRARTSVAIVLDESASMARSAGAGAAFDEALERVGEIIELLDEGDEAFLVTARSPATSLIPDGTVSPDVVRRALAERTVTDAATDYTGAVEVALEHLAAARNLNREIFIIGDMQSAGWGPAVDIQRPATDERSWPPRVYVLPVEAPGSNAGVVSASVERLYGGTPGRHAVVAEVANFGTRAIETPVRLFMDGVQVGQTGIRAEAGGVATARFAVTLDESVWHGGLVAIKQDAFTRDDERSIVIPPARTVEVLIARPEDSTEDAVYVARALDPTGSSERFRPVVVDPGDIARQEQGRFPVVVLADVGRLDDAAERWLRRHVEAGGGLFVVLGNRTDVRAWSGGALEELSRVALTGPVDRRGGVRLAPSGRGHPLLEGLTTGDRLIEDVPVRRALAARTSVETVLELPGIGPALTFAGAGDGAVAVLLFGLERAASDLSRSGLVVPLLHRVVGRLSGPASGAAVGTTGRPLDVPLAAQPTGGLVVETPNGRTVSTVARTGIRAIVTIEDTDTAGIYRVTDGSGMVAMAALTIDPAESALAAASVGAVAERLPGVDVRWIGSGEAVADAVLVARRGREIWRVFLYAALALLAVEMLLARQRGA